MLLIFGTDFSKLGVYSKSVTKTLYWTFLVSEGISLSLSEMQVIRYFLCLRDIGEKSLNRLLDCYCCLSLKTATGDVLEKKWFWKFCKFYRKISVVLSLFNKVADLRPANFLKRDSNTGASPVKFVKLLRKNYLWNSASVSSQVILFTMHEKDTANEA